MTKDIEKWWNEASKGYQEDSKIRTKSAHYGPYAPDENKLKLLGNVKGVQNFIMKKLTSQGINAVENQLEFKRNFGFEVNLGLLKFSWGASEK